MLQMSTKKSAVVTPEILKTPTGGIQVESFGNRDSGYLPVSVISGIKDFDDLISDLSLPNIRPIIRSDLIENNWSIPMKFTTLIAAAALATASTAATAQNVTTATGDVVMVEKNQSLALAGLGAVPAAGLAAIGLLTVAVLVTAVESESDTPN